MKLTLLAGLALLFVTLASGYAEDAPTAPVAPVSPVTHLGGSTWQIAAYLAGLVVLIAGGGWLLKNGIPSMQRNKGERKLNISETRGLGARQFLVVAEYDNRKMLIGVCPGRIEYLCTLSGAEPEFPKLAPEKPE
jgi:flagellar protein FliO/FliZ